MSALAPLLIANVFFCAICQDEPQKFPLSKGLSEEKGLPEYWHYECL